jgi:hypothetical protein
VLHPKTPAQRDGSQAIQIPHHQRMKSSETQNKAWSLSWGTSMVLTTVNENITSPFYVAQP